MLGPSDLCRAAHHRPRRRGPRRRRTLYPVSYTGLDVYKRQHWNRSRKSNIGSSSRAGRRTECWALLIFAGPRIIDRAAAALAAGGHSTCRFQRVNRSPATGLVPPRRRQRLFARVLDPFADGGRQHVEIGAHEERLAFTVAEIAVIGLDHRPHLRRTGLHRIDDEVAEIAVAREARVGTHGSGDAFGGGTLERLHHDAALMRRQRRQRGRIDGRAGGDADDQRGRGERCENHVECPFRRKQHYRILPVSA